MKTAERFKLLGADGIRLAVAIDLHVLAWHEDVYSYEVALCAKEQGISFIYGGLI